MTMKESRKHLRIGTSKREEVKRNWVLQAMARTYCALEADKDVIPKGWRLAHSLSGNIFKKLRQRGFYANFTTLQDLESHCIRFAKDPYAETAARLAQPLSCFKESSSGPNNSQVERVPISPSVEKVGDAIKNSKTIAEKTVASLSQNESSEDDIISDWYINGIDGNNIPITQLPYDESNVPSEPQNAFLGYMTAEKKVRVLRWKLALTTANELAIHVKTEMLPDWLPLGKPRVDYEETIRSLLTYVHLSAIATQEMQNSNTILFHLQKKFDYWKVKPNLSDVRESLMMMKKLKLCLTYPLDNQFLSRIVEETEVTEDTDKDSETKPLHFKRLKRESDVKLGSHFQPKDLDHVPLSRRLHNVETKSTLQNTVDTVLDRNLHDASHIDRKQDMLEVDKIKERVKRIMHDSFHKTAKNFSHGSHLTDQARQRYVNSTGPFSTISKLWNITSAAKQALSHLDHGGNVEGAMKICPKNYLDDFFKNEVILKDYRVFEFFPSISKQKEIAEKINCYVQNDDTVVEICSRTIDYFSFLRERLAISGKQCDYKRYRIQQLQNKGKKSCMNIDRLPSGSKLLVCLTFSFSEWGEQSNSILDYTLGLKPKLIVIISPIFSRRIEEHASYNLISVDSEVLQDEALWPWGLMNIPSLITEKKKGASPILYVWSRTDLTAKHRLLASEVGQLHKSGRSRI